MIKTHYKLSENIKINEEDIKLPEIPNYTELPSMYIMYLYIRSKLIKRNKNIMKYLPTEISKFITATNNNTDNNSEIDVSQNQTVIV